MIQDHDDHIKDLARLSTLPNKAVFPLMVQTNNGPYPLHIPDSVTDEHLVAPGDWVQFYIERPGSSGQPVENPCAILNHHYSLKECLTRRMLTPKQCMLRLARSFEVLIPKLTTGEEWDSAAFALRARKFSSSEVAAARFVLTVWNPHTKWKCGAFNAVDAVSTWSPHDRLAFTRWCLDPWWP